jgi:hypothetical protein
MTMVNAWEELGGAAADQPPRTQTPVLKLLHQWKLIAQQFGVSKHVCNRCGTVRTRINQGDRFPATRYVTRDDRHSERTPSCQP